ncbi:cystathionine beta-lyase family protein involved in aluminum resistance [Sporomusaceae bacterium BoRhaA]|uniref:methionine gamma-lyase family protein n=1 Tax=Pelorhabdus rhamnosifermentans TaxID=2772457 RepID=UPI0035E4041B|nr:cystathionine beta-lyase family protein involved in aluminum resistance [Pelorhabdus rhamnosifermentans]
MSTWINQTFSTKLRETKMQALAAIEPAFREIDEIAQMNTGRVLDAFRRYQLSDYDFRQTTGYAYGDAGRDKLEQIWADLCGAEQALLRTQFVSGTHALTCVLFGILRPGDELLAATGAPYDTIQTVIGFSQPTAGSLIDWGVTYRELAMTDQGIDLERLPAMITDKTKVVLLQRSRGYSLRKTLTIDDIKQACARIHAIKPDCICFVDNCYGEFVESCEPTAVGADVIAGSLIKNPGGGIAPNGGYVAGRKDLVELAAYRLTAPGLGAELGASLTGNRLLYQGLFLAPHVVAQAVKGAIFAAAYFSLLGYKVFPQANESRSDIIQAITLGSPEKMVAFCRGLQHFSPVDAHAFPEPSGMPGYADAVIMAGGTFIQGSSIELSADGPIRAPFAVYLQGGLTFEHCIMGVMGAAAELENVDR